MSLMSSLYIPIAISTKTKVHAITKTINHKIRIPANTSRIIKINSFTITGRGRGGGFYMVKLTQDFNTPYAYFYNKIVNLMLAA